jgi:uncharacterized protein with ATP-grasp and redox domains
VDLERKVALAKRALDSIIDHDDAPFEEVKARVEGIAAYVARSMSEAALRRTVKDKGFE